MRPPPKLLLLLPGTVALLAQCHRADPGPADPAAQLPPATQTGAHTFGCLLNGQPWTPTTGTFDNNHKLVYDPTYAGGSLQVQVTYFIGTGGAFQAITFGAATIKAAGAYNLSLGTSNNIFYTDTGIPAPCNEYENTKASVYQSGQLTVTRLDQSAGIVAGTFAFNLWQPGYDTVRVTQGRFDYKL